MVDLQTIEEEIQGAEARDVGTETHKGPTKPVLQTQKTPYPFSAFIKENIDVLRTMVKEHDQQAKIKATPRRLAYADSDNETLARSLTPSRNKEPLGLRRSRRLEDRSRTKKKARRERPNSKRKRYGHQETSSDSEYKEGSKDTYEDLNSPYKRPKPTPFTQRITRFKYHRRAKLPRNIRVYEGNKDPKDHLSIFSAAAEHEEWPMPVWCKMFCQTLGGVDIRQNNQRNGRQGRNNVKVINMIRGRGNRKRPFEGERFGLTDELTFLTIPRNRLTDEPIKLEERIKDHQV
nr:reverse transcriptase domain-containing protein [Tanacetum cinerariifolium]